MKSITAIELIFEDTESACIPAESIGIFQISDIHTDVSRVAMNSILETRSCGEVILELLPEADVTSDGFVSETCTLFKKLKNSNNITQIALHYKNEPPAVILVPWNHQDKYENAYQSTWRKNDHMYVVINATGSIPKELFEPQS